MQNSFTQVVDTAIVNKKRLEEVDTRFEKFIGEVLNFEGEYVNDPDDPGGATNRGISWNTWKDNAKKHLGVEPTLENLKKLTVDGAKKIYKEEFYSCNQIDRIQNPKVAFMIFDWIVNAGGNADEQIQIMLNNKYGTSLKVDKTIGIKTIEAINRISDQQKLLLDIAQSRREYYEEIANKKPSRRKFRNGWMNRVDECLNIKF